MVRHEQWRCFYCAELTSDPTEGPTGHRCLGSEAYGVEKYIGETEGTHTIIPSEDGGISPADDHPKTDA
jgi:hypothetical protein